MIERELLLNSTTTVLLICLLWQPEWISRRLGGGLFLLAVAGGLLPLLDPLLNHLLAADRIDILTRPARFSAPFHAGAAIGSLWILAVFMLKARRAAAVGLALVGGWCLHSALAFFTTGGVALLAPFSAERYSLPFYPVGHPPLLLALFVALVPMERWPGGRRWLLPLAGVLAIAYFSAGALQFGLISARAEERLGGAGAVHVYPDNSWLTRWRVVTEFRRHYELRRHRLGEEDFGEASRFPRWNDEELFLKLLGDPVVDRFYFQVFRHPVVRLKVSGSQITMLMQELRDQEPLVPGRTLYLESDLNGRNRFFQVQRFN